jgi:hypothetical protein
MRTETLSFLIYLLSVGVLGLLGYELYDKHDMRWVGVPGVGAPPLESVTAYRKKTAQGGSRRAISDRRWSYSARMGTWWDVIKRANLTGKLPPPPTEVTALGESGTPAVVETPQTPLSEILKIVSTLGSVTGMVKVKYKEGSGVIAPPTPGSGFGGSGIGGSGIGGSGLGGAGTGSPAYGDTVPSAGAAPGQTQAILGPMYQDLAMGQGLYEPFQEIKAVRIFAEGSNIGVVFSRPAHKPEDAKAGKRIEETIYVNQLSVQGNMIHGLDIIAQEGGGGSPGKGSALHKGTWKNPGDKTKKTNGVWQISVPDQKYLSSPDQLFEDVAVEDFVEEWEDPTQPGSGKKIRVKGVAIRKLSAKLRRFGVKEGEILIKINGTPVSGRNNAIKVGRQAYDRGVRSFQLTFLNNYGREEVRSYQAPDKK